jgi:hypothetical protein
MIKSGRNGSVKWDPAGGTGAAAAVLLSIRNFKLSMKTDKLNVTCFGDLNKIYVPALKDISGSIAGFYNSSALELYEAADAEAPGWLELIPDTTDAAAASLLWSGLAYLDSDIDTSVDTAPAVTGTFMAAGPWSIPASALVRTPPASGERRGALPEAA